jgi:hypothetical protein
MTQRPLPLTADEIVDRLRLFSPGIVEDVRSVALHMLETEDRRETRLDAKAHVLMLASSLLLASAIATVCLLRPLPSTLAVSFVAALMVGLAAVLAAVRVLFVSGDYRGTDERDVLNADELSAADEEFREEQKKEKEERGNIRAQGRYRRLLIAHWWQMWQRHYALHERKATALRTAQVFFMLFVAMLTFVGIAFSFDIARCA